MKLEQPLAGLFARCQTICEAECCGIDAYDFNPIHVASFLLLYPGAPDPNEVQLLRSQLAALKANYGSRGASAVGVTLDEINQIFSGAEVDTLVDTILASIDAALALISTIESSKVPSTPG